MVSVHEAAADFLACERIAVTGVSREPKGHGGNVVADRLRSRGYQVFPVNPNADEIGGRPCWHRLSDIPGGVDAVVIATRPEAADATVAECVELGVRRVWMHRAFGAGSVCESATALGRRNGMTVIDGGCPLMFAPVSDPGHKVIRAIARLTGKLPARV